MSICLVEAFMDVCAHCYRASLVSTLFISHKRTTSYVERAYRVKNSTKHIELMAFVLPLFVDIFRWMLSDPFF